MLIADALQKPHITKLRKRHRLQPTALVLISDRQALHICLGTAAIERLEIFLISVICPYLEQEAVGD